MKHYITINPAAAFNTSAELWKFGASSVTLMYLGVTHASYMPNVL